MHEADIANKSKDITRALPQALGALGSITRQHAVTMQRRRARGAATQQARKLSADSTSAHSTLRRRWAVHFRNTHPSHEYIRQPLQTTQHTASDTNLHHMPRTNLNSRQPLTEVPGELASTLAACAPLCAAACFVHAACTCSALYCCFVASSQQCVQQCVSDCASWLQLRCT